MNISKELLDETQRRVDEIGGEFKTVEWYIEFVLSEFLREEEPEQAYTPEEEEEIKERLRKPEFIQEKTLEMLNLDQYSLVERLHLSQPYESFPNCS